VSGKKPRKLKIFFFSIFNGIASMILSALVIVPLMCLVLLIITWNLSETKETILDKLDIIIVIFCIGTVFEILDRVIRGIRKSKILTIRRDKSDRW
jgi:uncharacterized membrane protein YqjE